MKQYEISKFCNTFCQIEFAFLHNQKLCTFEQIIDLTQFEKNAKKYLYSPIHSVVSEPHRLITAVLAIYAAQIPGDFVETGVYKGGTSVIMARIARNMNTSKTHWACDSFKGLPEPQLDDSKCHHIERRESCNKGNVGLFKSSQKHFEMYVASEALTNVQIVSGWFHETLPPRDLHAISFLRLDGDLYNSTIIALQRLYPLVSSRGMVYVDDYGSFSGCSRAVDEYLTIIGLKNVHLNKVTEKNGNFEAVWFQKP
jgi:hypothetical protein